VSKEEEGGGEEGRARLEKVSEQFINRSFLSVSQCGVIEKLLWDRQRLVRGQVFLTILCALKNLIEALRESLRADRGEVRRGGEAGEDLEQEVGLTRKSSRDIHLLELESPLYGVAQEGHRVQVQREGSGEVLRLGNIKGAMARTVRSVATRRGTDAVIIRCTCSALFRLLIDCLASPPRLGME
jgi:hypothetical protein